MMSSAELDGLINSLTVLGANGFGNFKDELAILNYVRFYGEEK